MTMRFEGKSVLITGATGGFGQSAARLFAGEGARLVLSDLDQARLDTLSEELAPADVVCLAADVSQEETARHLVALAEDKFGTLDIAINNAGIGQDYLRLDQIDPADARRIFEIDLIAVFHALHNQLPAMSNAFKRDGQQRSILNVASIAGLSGAPRLGVYSAAKHGVVGLTKSAALEFARHGVRVNALCPSFARTAMVMDGLEGADAEAHVVRGIPMRRLAEPDEITQAMLWAVDPANSFMTGQTIALDGGLSAM